MCWISSYAPSRCSGWPIKSLGDTIRSFLPLDVGMDFMRNLGNRGSRLWSLGGAHRRFVPAGVGSHRIRHLGVRGSRWRCLGNALGFPRPPHLRWVPTPTAKNLRCAPPRLRNQSPWTPRRRIRWVSTPKATNLRCAPPRLRNQSPWTPRRRIRWVPIPEATNLRCAPPRLCHRLPRPLRLPMECV